MKKLTREQAAVVGAFTGVVLGPFQDIHKYAERVLKRPIVDLEFADDNVARKIQDAAEADFLSICPDESDAEFECQSPESVHRYLSL